MNQNCRSCRTSIPRKRRGKHKQTMDLDYKCLLYHTNVRWLSRRKVLKGVILLKAELISLLEAEKKTLDFLFMTRSGGLR